MIYFYSFNIFVLMILFNFLLAIICDAFGEVKANASESVSVTTELAPMMRDAWRNTFRSMYPSHVPEERVRRQLRIWMGENPDDSEEDEVEESADHIFKYDGEKEIDSAGLKRVLRRCVIETYQRTADAKFLLSQRGEGFLGRGKKNTRALATAEEIEAAAEMLLQQVGQEPEQADSDEDGPSEIEKLQESLEKLPQGAAEARGGTGEGDRGTGAHGGSPGATQRSGEEDPRRAQQSARQDVKSHGTVGSVARGTESEPSTKPSARAANRGGTESGSIPPRASRAGARSDLFVHL